MKYVIGAAGTPGAGKSTFCKVLKKHYMDLNLPVKLYNLDAGCEVSLSYVADWDITNTCKVSTVMKEEKLGSNGALMEVMRKFMEEDISILLKEMEKCPDGTYFIMDLPGQVELFTVRDTIKNFYSTLTDLEYKVCNVYLLDPSVLRDEGFFVSYSTNVTMSMLQLAVPQLNLITKMDIFHNAKEKDKLEYPFDWYARGEIIPPWKIDEEFYNFKPNFDAQALPMNKKYGELIRRLANTNRSYNLVNYFPFTAADEKFVASIRFDIERALGSGFRRDKDPRGAIFVIEETEVERELKEYVEVFLEKCVKDPRRRRKGKKEVVPNPPVVNVDPTEGLKVYERC